MGEVAALLILYLVVGITTVCHPGPGITLLYKNYTARHSNLQGLIQLMGTLSYMALFSIFILQIRDALTGNISFKNGQLKKVSLLLLRELNR